MSLTSDCDGTGIGLTILCPRLSMVFLTLVWAIAFGTVFAMAQLTDGSFEFEGAGLLLVGAACVVRALDGERRGSLRQYSRPSTKPCLFSFKHGQCSSRATSIHSHFPLKTISNSFPYFYSIHQTLHRHHEAFDGSLFLFHGIRHL